MLLLLLSRGAVCGLVGPVAVNVTVHRCGDLRFGVLICAALAVAVTLQVFDVPPLYGHNCRGILNASHDMSI